MSNIQNHGPTAQSSDIIEAEFVEIDNHGRPNSNTPKAKHGRVTYAAIGGGLISSLLLLTMCVAMETVPPDSDSNAVEQTESGPNASSVESVACGRADVLAMVSKETRSVLLKAALPNVVGQAMMGLIDPKRFREEWEAADGKFSGVRATAESDPNQAAVSVECTGRFRIDSSNAAAGQDVVQFPLLRWRIDFPDRDLASADFTIEVNRPSIYEGMLVNGKAVVAAPEPEPAPESDSLTISQMLTPREAWFDRASVMLDTMGPNDQPQCDGPVWSFDAMEPNTFSLSGGESDTTTTGKYTLDGAKLHLYDMAVTPIGSDYRTAGKPAPDITYDVVKLPGSSGMAVRIGKISYRVCAPG